MQLSPPVFYLPLKMPEEQQQFNSPTNMFFNIWMRRHVGGDDERSETSHCGQGDIHYPESTRRAPPGALFPPRLYFVSFFHQATDFASNQFCFSNCENKTKVKISRRINPLNRIIDRRDRDEISDAKV